MNCFNHNSVTAVATCVDCAKGLCPSCTRLYALPICTTCNAERVKADKSAIVSKYIPSVIALIVGAVIGWNSSPNYSLYVAICFGWIFAGIPWGWKVINFLTPKVFLFLPIVGWVFYFLFKTVLAGFVGIIAMPIGVGTLIFKHVQANQKARNVVTNLQNNQ